MSKKELLIAVERLVRFKFPEQRRNRVYKDIVLKFLIEPRINSKEFSKTSVEIIDEIVKIIWDFSVENLGGNKASDSSLNSYLAFEETKLFSKESLLNGLRDKDYIDYVLNSPLNLSGFLTLVEKEKNLTLNLQRLVSINCASKEEKDFELLYKKAEEIRKEQSCFFPLKLLVLAEGATEEKLLPAFAKAYGLDFAQKGIMLIASGGKNQVARLYNQYRQCLNIPIIVLLDEDARNIAENMEKNLQNNDEVFVFSDGEFEDILSLELIVKSANKFYKNTGSITKKELNGDMQMAKILENIWKEKGFGEFNKSLFADIIAENILSRRDVPEVLGGFFEKIKNKIN